MLSRPPCLRLFAAALVLATAPPAYAQQTLPTQPSPPVSPATLTAAKTLMASASFQQAESLLRPYLIASPASAPARYMLAYTLLRQNRPKESLEEYTRAAALEPPSAEQLRNVGQDYVLLADYEDAGTWISRSIQMSPKDPEGWYALGRLRYTQQRFGEAAGCFQQTLLLAPKSARAENNLGLSYEGLNRTDDAVAAYRQAIAWGAASPKPSEQPLLNLAIVLVHRGNLDEAEPLLVRASTIAPEDPHIHEQLGQLFMQRANYPAAQQHLEAATRLDPDRSSLHFLLGQAYRHLGRQQEAKAQFDLASRLANPKP